MIAYRIKITVITDYWSILCARVTVRCRKNVGPTSIDKSIPNARLGSVNQWI